MIDFARASDRATPGLERTAVGAWILRNGLGDTGRANSCTPHGDPGRSVAAAVDEVETWFAARGRAPVFQIYDDTDATVVAELDRRAYATGSVTEILAAPVRLVLDRLRPPRSLAVELAEAMPAFLADQLSPARSAEMNSADLARWFVTAGDQTGVLGSGMALGDGDLVGIFAMRSDPQRQGEGAGSAVLEGLLRHGLERGASTVWLQVEADNRRAGDWYRRLGLARRTGYHYRRPDDT